jgi:cytochrome c oxidase cbb3-type subunit 2
VTRVGLLIFGVIATIGFAAIILVGLPRVALFSVTAPPELQPYDPVQQRGRHVYIANGCVYCHSQQIRNAAFTTDVLRGWGDRASVPADYVYDRPHLLGTMRTGPDLINVGVRLPNADWHLIHLYDPRSLVEWSIMPAFPYLFEEKDPEAVGPGDRVVPVRGPRAPAGKVVVATEDALALVEYLLSLRRVYPVPEVESAPGAEGVGPAAGAAGAAAARAPASGPGGRTMP